MSGPTDRPLRILAFPGLLQNANILRAKLEPVRRALGGCEFTVVDPLLIVHMPTISSSDDEPPISPGHEHRSWWIPDHKRENCDNFPSLDALVIYFRSILETQGPFDGVLGFSQGAAAMALLLALVQRPSLHEEFARGGREGVEWPPRQMKFAFLVSGFLPKDRTVVGWFGEKLRVPSCHILGQGDTIVSPQTSMGLADAFEDPRVHFHAGGHFIPTQPSMCAIYRSFISSQATSHTPTAIPLLPTISSLEPKEKASSTSSSSSGSGRRSSLPIVRGIPFRRRLSAARIVILRSTVAV